MFASPPPPPPPAIIGREQPSAPSPTKATVDQIVRPGPTADLATTAIPTECETSLDLAQVPADRAPVHVAPNSGTGDPPRLQAPAPSGMPDEVLRAWRIIEARGQTPTADLLTAEVGSDTVSKLFGTSGLPSSVFVALSALAMDQVTTPQPTASPSPAIVVTQGHQ